MTVLTAAQLEQLVRFSDKANGWMFIALGAFLVAIGETWWLRELYGWPLWVFYLLLAVMLAACAANTAYRVKRSDDALHHSDPRAGEAG